MTVSHYQPELIFDVFASISQRQIAIKFFKYTDWHIEPRVGIAKPQADQVFDELISCGHTAESAQAWIDRYLRIR